MESKLRTYAQRLRHAPVGSGQLLPATALQPLIGPNGALMWTDQRLGALAARRGQALAVKPPARSQPRYTRERGHRLAPSRGRRGGETHRKGHRRRCRQRLRRPAVPEEDEMTTTSKPTSMSS